MPLKPWEEGYIPPAPIHVDKRETASRAGRQTQINKELGIPPKPKRAQHIKPPGAPRTNMERQAKFDSQTEHTLPLARKQFLDLFIYHYLHDFNASMAYIRAGGSPAGSRVGGSSALRTQYVQNQIRIVTEQLDENQLLTRAEILVGIKKEANYHGDDGSSSARVRAWGLLAKIKGMDVPEVKEVLDAGPKGGVMVIPMAVTEVEWQDAAKLSQTALKVEVRK